MSTSISDIQNLIPDGLLAHWPFNGSLEAHTDLELSVTNHGVSLIEAGGGRQAARFNGESSYLEIAPHPALNFGSENFSVTLWVETDETSDYVGDFVSKFHCGDRTGWSFNAVTNSGTTTAAQSNYRNLQFGIDAGGPAPQWQNCGRPGNAAFIYALATINGDLFAGTFEKEAHQQGHLWRYLGEDQWEDWGSPPDGSSTVTAVTGYLGEIYCSSARYYPTGSRLGPFQNKKPGGHVYRVTGDGQWIDCGNPGATGATPEPDTDTLTGYESAGTDWADDASALTVFQGNLYAISFHRKGVYRYLGRTEWEHIGLDSRVMTLAAYRDQLYALANGGPIYRYDGGQEWTHCGLPGDSTQTYAAVVHHGKMLVGTWPDCAVLSYEGGQEWHNYGCVGYEKEVMAMALYNNKVYFGTLPMANAWRFDEGEYTFIGNLDNSPEYFLRRVWSMAVYDGKLFAGTLPAGQVLSYEAGKVATLDRALRAGWQHLAAVREDDVLKIYLNGELVAQSSAFEAAAFNLDNEEPLKIGFGAHEYFKGNMSDVRLYDRALNSHELQELANHHPTGAVLEAVAL